MWPWGVIFIVSILILIVGVVLYFLNSWAGKKAAQQNEMVAQHKQTVSIYVIDKKKDKLTNANFPKAMTDQIPRMGRMFKMPLVKAKIGPQIMTLMCEEETYKILPTKKTVTVEMAGAYIVSMKGKKTKMELAAQRKERRKDGGDQPVSWMDKIKAKFGR